jgi:glycerophosphoryl diester phosphodiesterase
MMAWLPYIAAASLYPLVSCFLLKRPLRRHQHTIRTHPLTLQPMLRVRTSAHRGGAMEAPENTIAAFDHSTKLGIDLFELDVHLTKDKQVVVYHDHTVDRLAASGGQTGVEGGRSGDLECGVDEDCSLF